MWILSISLNILYALFTTLSYVCAHANIEYTIWRDRKVYTKPIYKGLYESLNKEYLGDLLNYWVTYTNETFGAERTLLYVVLVVVAVFLLKNIFNYLGQLTMVFLKNSVLKDLRSIMYDKIISLPLPFFAEQKKGDLINRATGDIGNYQ